MIFKQVPFLKLNSSNLCKEHGFPKGNMVGCYLSSFNFKKQDFYYAHFNLLLYILLPHH